MNVQVERLRARLLPEVKRNPEAIEVATYPVKMSVLRDVLYSVFRQCGFETPQIDDASRMVTAVRSLPLPPPLSGSRRTCVSMTWEAVEEKPRETIVAWTAVDQSPGSGGRPDRKATTQIAEVLAAGVAAAKGVDAEDEAASERILGPGEVVRDPGRGGLRDYSGLATVDDVSDLHEGELPLGQYAFDGETAIRGADLQLGLDRTKARRTYRGTLICAPQNSGKTAFLIRWALAANRAGYNIFLIDVKGNLKAKLGQRLQGRVCYFSTDPEETESQRINFLDGLDPLSPLGSERIREIATALLPGDGQFERGSEESRHRRNDIAWLTGLLHILKLREVYRPESFVDERGEERPADLNDLYDLAADENLLYATIQQLRADESVLRDVGAAVPVCGVDHWLREISLLINPQRFPPKYSLPSTLPSSLSSEVAGKLQSMGETIFGNLDLFQKALQEALTEEELSQEWAALEELARLPPEGDRRPEYSFRDYTQTIVTSLEPFAKHGTLYDRTRGGSVSESNFSLDELDSTDQPVSIIMAAREQDLEKATTILALTVKRLQHILFERVDLDDDEVRPVLLLLDETRRIPTFEANKYITYAREAKAGCVVVYQSLDQIGDDKKISEVLENVGQQIYFGSLVGNTARHFIQMLPKRYRQSVSEQITESGQTLRGRSVTFTKELVDYFTTNELYKLPAGAWPALVYLNDLPRRKPILVDLFDPELADANGSPKRRRARKMTGPVEDTGPSASAQHE
jgi:hypothetical protein